MKKILFTSLGLLLLLSVTSCKTTQKRAAAPQQETEESTEARKVPTIPRDEFDGTWIVKKAEKKAVVGEAPAEITFDLTNGRIYGNDGCNVVNGTFALGNENELQFGSLISTQKDCGPEVTDHAVQRALANTCSYKRDINSRELCIKFCDKRGRTIMTLEKRRVDLLNGAWTVVDIEGSPVEGEKPALVIDIPEARLSGSAGCNRIFGQIALDGTPYGIAFVQIAASRKTCPEIETEMKFLAALEKVRGFYPTDDNHAVLYQSPDVPLITLKKGL